MSETIKISQMEVIDAASGEMLFEVSIKRDDIWRTRSVSADQLKQWLDGEFELSELGTASKKDIEFFLQSANNLSDLDDAEAARANLELGSAATEDSDLFLQTEKNLSDLEDVEDARANLGLGSGATSDADDFMRKDSNLGDVASAPQARDNLGLGSAATREADDFATAAQGAKADGAIPALEKGAPTGVATLNADGKLRAEQVPRLAISEPFVVSSEQEMLALDVQVGDVAIRTDSSETFILQQEPAGDINNWLQILTPPDGVTSFNGRAGTVESESGDYSADQISYASASVKDELERLESEKVEKEAGKGLSANDFTDSDKQKLDGIENEANKTEVVQETGDSSTAVMSQEAVTEALGESLKSQNHVYAQKTVTGETYEITDADNGHIIFFTSGTGVDVSFASVTMPVNCVLVQAGDGAVELIDAVVSLDDATATRGKGAAVSLVYNVSGGFWWAGGGIE